MSLVQKNLLILLVIFALIVIPLVVKSTAKFSGADGAAIELIEQMNPNYEPWFSSIWEPPSGEVESLLFALQAALGAGVLGYYIGYKRGQTKEQE